MCGGVPFMASHPEAEGDGGKDPCVKRQVLRLEEGPKGQCYSQRATGGPAGGKRWPVCTREVGFQLATVSSCGRESSLGKGGSWGL